MLHDQYFLLKEALEPSFATTVTIHEINLIVAEPTFIIVLKS